MKPKKVKDDLMILYDNRNLLDLYNNVKNSWNIKYANLDGGINCFFENRSQLSRLANLEQPSHVTSICEYDDGDCGFVIQHYF